ncbi:MAG TPA: FmdB family zinc ribbon protein [Bryobacteraceae bacterium]
MPLYEYLCEKCGARFELIEKFSAEPKTVHEGCGGAVHRLVSAPALQFKGSGFYITDYGKGGSSKGDSSRHGSEGKSDSKSKSESKSDSKSSDSSSSSSSSTPASTSSSSSSSSDSGSKS